MGSSRTDWIATPLPTRPNMCYLIARVGGPAPCRPAPTCPPSHAMRDAADSMHENVATSW